MKTIQLIIVLVVCWVLWLGGAYVGKMEEREQWEQSIDTMRVNCVHTMQPHTFPTGELFLIKAESYGTR